MTALERTRWVPIGLLVAVGVAAAMQFAKVAAVFPAVAGLYAAGDIVAALLISAPAIVGILLGLTASVTAAHVGFRRVIVWCLSIGIALSLVQSVLPPLPLFLGSRVLEGVAHLGLVIACPVLIVLLSAPRHVSLAMSIWGTFFGLAFAIAGWIAPMIDGLWGLGAVFLAHAILLAVLLLAVLLLLPRVSGDGPRANVHGEGFVHAHVEAYRNPRSFLPGLVFIFHTLMYVPLVTFLPMFADPSVAPLLLVWMPLVSIAGTVAAGFIAHYTTTPPVVLLIGYAGVAALIVAIWAVTGSAWPMLVLPLVLMVFSGLIQGASFGLIPALCSEPGMVSHANGVLTQLGNLGSTLGPPLFAALIAGTGTAAGMTPVMIVVVVLCLGGLAVSFVAVRFTGAGRPDPATPITAPVPIPGGD